MNTKKFITPDVVWNYFSVFTKVCITLIITIVANRHFANEDLANWYIVLSYNTIYLAISTGLQPTLSRHLQYFIINNAPRVKTKSFVSGIIGFYIFLGLLVFILNLTLLTITGLLSTSFQSLLFSLSILISVSGTSLDAIYTARNKIGEIKKYLSIGLIIQLFIFLSTYKFGLNSYLISNIIGVSIQKSLMIYRINTNTYKVELRNLLNCVLELSSSLRHSFKQLISSISGYVILRLPILVGPFFLSQLEIQQLGLSIQILSLTILIASVLVESKIPLLVEKFKAHDKKFIQSFNKTILSINTINFFFLTLVFIFLDSLFTIVFNKNIIESEVLRIMLVAIYIFENNHSLFQNILSTTDNLSFYKYNLVTMCMIVLVTLILYYQNALSINTLLLTILVLNLYNNIIWPWKVIKLTKNM